MSNKLGDLVVGLIAIGLGLFETISGTRMEKFGNPESAGTFPFVAGLATVALGAVLLGQWAWQRKKARESPAGGDAGEGKRNSRTVAVELTSLVIVFGLLALLAWLLPMLHFRTAGLMFLLAFMLVLGGYKRPLMAVVVSLVTTVTIAEVFTKIFRLVLP